MIKYFSSEAVSEGHPDKICDQISDLVLDMCKTVDPYCYVACECLGSGKQIFVRGEVRLANKELMPNDQQISAKIRDLLKDIGYDSVEKGLDYRTVEIDIDLHPQATNITNCANNGAGDQGMMFGYATNATPDYMPLPISLARAIIKQATEVRKANPELELWPDMKSQTTIAYEKFKHPWCSAIVFTYQAKQEIPKALIIEKILIPALLKYDLCLPPQLYISSFQCGSIEADTGLTGRKIIVDTYGGWSRHGGGAFSGKDGTKVDRSGAYMARYIAKNIVAAGLARECEVQLAYVIGHKKPVSVFIETFGTKNFRLDNIAIAEIFELEPQEIINQFQLNQPIYLKTAMHHFGEGAETFPWEQIDKVEMIKLKYCMICNSIGEDWLIDN